MSTPKFSIVTISFNQATFLERALRSVLDQDYPNLEYIVVDAGSTDESQDIIQKYRSRLARVILEPDRGPADGLNKGFAAATGELFGYLNADDAYLPGALAGAATALRDHQIDVVSGHGYVVDSRGRPIRRLRSTRFDAESYVYGAAVLMQQSTFFRSSTFRAVGAFNIENRTCWDGELMLEMAARGARFAVTDAYWSIFRLHDESISGSQTAAQSYRRTQAALYERVTGHPPRKRDALKRALARVAKWVRDPAGVLIRVRDATVGPPPLANGRLL